MSEFAEPPERILARLRQLRDADAPTHGGRVLSYVYDSGLEELDELAGAAMRMVQPVNGLDPTTFTSVAVMERELIGFAAALLGGKAVPGGVVGSVTTGGTESCLLAVKSARDSWHGEGVPRLLAPTTAHAAFQKAAHYLGLRLDLVPVEASGRVSAKALISRMADDVALVVVSAPSYPHAALDPVAEIAAASADRGIPVHVDACIGGLVLPFWEGVPAWDFRVAGVTSISADLHKYGYAPKGASVLLHRDRDRHRAQYFATTGWPGYPVVNPTILGSKSAGPLAASWAITRALGRDGFGRLAASCARSTAHLVALVRSIEGLRVVGDPVGPLFAVAVDDDVAAERRVDPHHWADAVRERGWLLQLQPGLAQADGTRLPHTTHLTVTPVTERNLAELGQALGDAADEVRGIPRADPNSLLGALPEGAVQALAAPLDSDTAAALLAVLGLGAADVGSTDGSGVVASTGMSAAVSGTGGLPPRMAPLLAVIEALPPGPTERLLVELLARLVEPPSGSDGG